MSIKYDEGLGNFENWIVKETNFDSNYLGKCEAIMSLGNGYLGLRSALEENYIGETRNLFVSGTFNRFHESEVTELPNAADITNLDIKINGETFNLLTGKTKDYSRELNLKTGELTRTVIWESSKEENFKLTFKRFASLSDLHLIGMKVEIIPLDSDAKISIVSGIDGQQSNSGTQHFYEGEKRFYDKKFIELIQTTTESEIDFVFYTSHNVYVNDRKTINKTNMKIERRAIFEDTEIHLKKNDKFEFEKLSLVYTTRDLEFSIKDSAYIGKYFSENLRTSVLQELRENSLSKIKYYSDKKYEELLEESKNELEKKWTNYAITIESENNFDQLAVRFAIYHLIVMTPAHDSRYGIGAKGLSGEGYKGHSFWDTEIFILPFFSYTDPAIARKLLEYRYNTLEGARKKAAENGYEGAMYPWESAWMNDGEVTPIWGSVDIVNGKATKILSGFIEQHVTSDIAFATWQYYMITKDEEFMEKHGYEILLDTAKFWASRLEWKKENNRYEICNVIGPDEYKEHIDNNAFTNYMAKWNIDLAIKYYDDLKENKKEIFSKLNEKLGLEKVYLNWKDVSDKIYIPVPDEKTLLIAQDDTYLKKEIIDLTKYKNQENVGSMFQDYNLEQVNDIQVSKQADIMTLFYLLENKFSYEVKKANWDYYEPKTLHDSSLSLSTHAILANDISDTELAYALFEKASQIDLGTNMKTSDEGIHAASFGGLWQSAVCGFGGIRMLEGKLRINPKLPSNWSNLKFSIKWHNVNLNIEISKENITVKRKDNFNEKLEFEVFGKIYNLEKEIQITY